MKISSPGLSLATAAPSTSAVADAAAVGTAVLAARSDHLHGREAFAAPITQAFGDVAGAGVAVTEARSDHKHGIPSTWTKVVAGTIGAVASLDLASLSGYKRYHLMVHIRRAITDGGGSATLKLNNSGTHSQSRLHNTGNTVTGVQAVAQATSIIAAFLSSASACVAQYDILVTHDDAAASGTGYHVIASNVANSGSATQDISDGVEETAVASITEILLAFGVTIVSGNYVLYGSNEIA